MRKVILALVLSVASAVWADRVILTDGTVLQGRIRAKTSEKIIFEDEPGKFKTIPLSEVQKVERDDFKFPAGETPAGKPDGQKPEDSKASGPGSGQTAPAPASKPGSPLPLALEQAIEELIRKVQAEEARPPHFDSERFSAAIKALSPDVLQAIQRFTEVKDRVAALSLALEYVRYFMQKDFVYPCLGRVNPNADAQAFAAAARNISPQQMSKFCGLATSSLKEGRNAAAFMILINSSGAFVYSKGNMSAGAFNDAAANLDADKIDGVAHYFTDKMEAAYVLLRASGRFVGPDRRFDAEKFNSTLAGINQKSVDYVNAKLKKRNPARTVDLLLRPCPP